MRLIYAGEWVVAAAIAYAKHGKVLVLWTNVVNPDGTIASVIDVSKFEKELW